MDKIIKILAPFGVMGVVFVVALITATVPGVAGAAAFAAAMASIGPFGMLGGVATLGVAGIITSVAAEYGGDYVLKRIIVEQLKTKSKEEILIEIDKQKLVSKELKLKCKYYIEQCDSTINE